MEIRIVEASDRLDIVSLLERSQAATQLPNLAVIPPTELDAYLYNRHAIERYIATEEGIIVGHGMIEEPNPQHIKQWRNALGREDQSIIEMGGAFVSPELTGRGIWSALLDYRLATIRKMGAVPVSATWVQNDHVKKVFHKVGGTEAGEQATPAGIVSLFVFAKS